jgi:acyl-CoA hydrolase
MSHVAAQVGVRVEEEDVRTGARQHCCSAYLTFVSVLARPGADGRPARPLQRVGPTLPGHADIFEAAQRCGARALRYCFCLAVSAEKFERMSYHFLRVPVGCLGKLPS